MTRMLPVVVPAGSVTHQGLRLARALAVGCVICALPYLVPAFRLTQISGACILAAAVVGLNLLTGFGGQISLGHAAFFGLGAYTTGILITKAHLAVPLAFLSGVLMCFVVGVTVGTPALRLRGTYLALVTLAIGVVFPNLVSRFAGLTGGAAGMFGLTYPPPAGIAYFSGLAGQDLWLYWVAVVTLLVSCLVVWNLMRSRTGRAIIMLRDHEAAAIVGGVNRTAVHTLLFGISSGIAGLAGGVYAVNTGIITPDSFSLLLTIYFLVAMVLGGAASYWGPVFGGFAIYFVPVWTSDFTQGPVAGVLFGLIIIAMVFTMRSGIAGMLSALARRLVVISPRPPRGTADVGALIPDAATGESPGPAPSAVPGLASQVPAGSTAGLAHAPHDPDDSPHAKEKKSDE